MLFFPSFRTLPKKLKVFLPRTLLLDTAPMFIVLPTPGNMFHRRSRSILECRTTSISFVRTFPPPHYLKSLCQMQNAKHRPSTPLL
ncbi:hypothetical protein COOONC_18251 [Cooperia oncophora]